jgi:hypothetical protein
MKWEYSTEMVSPPIKADVRPSVPELEQFLNARAKDGWELAALTPLPDTTWIVAVFKRPSN